MTHFDSQNTWGYYCFIKPPFPHNHSPTCEHPRVAERDLEVVTIVIYFWSATPFVSILDAKRTKAVGICAHRMSAIATEDQDMFCEKAVALIIDLCLDDSPLLDSETCQDFLVLLTSENPNISSAGKFPAVFDGKHVCWG